MNGRRDSSTDTRALAEELEKLLGRPVELLTERMIRNPCFRAAVDQERQTNYARESEEAARRRDRDRRPHPSALRRQDARRCTQAFKVPGCQQKIDHRISRAPKQKNQKLH